MGKRLAKRIKASDKHIKNNCIYIHYGDETFNKDKFCVVENRTFPCNKPDYHSGLWASPVNASFGWRDFCLSEDFKTASLCRSFKFRLSKKARIYHIYTAEDLFALPAVDTSKYREEDLGYMSRYCIDFEKMSQHYDAIELHLYNKKGYLNNALYFYLYGWDCDSILIFNPDVINEMK